MLRRTGACLLRDIVKTEGLVVPPFTAYTRSGEVDLGAIPKHVEMIEGMGTPAIFLGGTASEGASQTIQERVAVAQVYSDTLKARGSSIRLMLHVGATSLKESQELASAGERIGVDAIATVTPTFFKPGSVPVMVEWMAELATAAPNTPFYYYHIPSMTMLPPTISVKKFLESAGASIPTLHGVKYTALNLCEYADLLTVEGGRYDVLAGLSEQMLPALSMGAKSSVSAPFNNPFAMVYYHKILKAFRAGDLDEALRVQLSINRLTFLLQHGGYGAPAALLRAMVKMETGFDLGPCRLPLKDISTESYNAVEKILRSDLKLL